MITSCLKTKPKKHQFQIQIANLTSSMSIESVTNSEDKSTVGFEVAFPIICATVSILALVVLKKYLKNLNEVIKNILIALSLHNLVSSMIAGGIILFWNGKNTILERCNTLHILTASNAIITVQTLALILFTKYYLAWKTAKLEAANLLIIIGLTVSDCVTGYGMAVAPTLMSDNNYRLIIRSTTSRFSCLKFV